MHIARRLVELDPANRDHRNKLATAYNSLASTQIAAGSLQEAAASYRASVDLRRQLVSEQPENTAYRRDLLVSYGSLADILGSRAGEHLGDTAGAIAALDEAAKLAEWAMRLDPADRRAIFDRASVELRLGGIRADEGDLPAALHRLQEARRLDDTLLAQEPGNSRYGFVAVVIARRLGETLLGLGRAADAAREYRAVRSEARKLLDGPNGPGARAQLVLATTALAAIDARMHDPRALSLADFALQEIGRKPLSSPPVDAKLYADLGRLYVELATGAPARERAARQRTAITCFEKSAEIWRRSKLVGAFESRRMKEIAALEAEMAKLRTSG